MLHSAKSECTGLGAHVAPRVVYYGCLDSMASKSFWLSFIASANTYSERTLLHVQEQMCFVLYPSVLSLAQSTDILIEFSQSPSLTQHTSRTQTFKMHEWYNSSQCSVWLRSRKCCIWVDCMLVSVRAWLEWPLLFVYLSAEGELFSPSWLKVEPLYKFARTQRGVNSSV
jgi:hypothetical protein